MPYKDKLNHPKGYSCSDILILTSILVFSIYKLLTSVWSLSTSDNDHLHNFEDYI